MRILVSPLSTLLLLTASVLASSQAQPVLTAASLPFYPPVARLSRVEGKVVVSMTITPDGRVEDVEAVSGPRILSDSAVENVKSWKFQAPGTAMRREVTFVYRIARKPAIYDFPYVKAAFFGVKKVEVETSPPPRLD